MKRTLWRNPLTLPLSVTISSSTAFCSGVSFSPISSFSSLINIFLLALHLLFSSGEEGKREGKGEEQSPGPSSSAPPSGSSAPPTSSSSRASSAVSGSWSVSLRWPSVTSGSQCSPMLGTARTRRRTGSPWWPLWRTPTRRRMREGRERENKLCCICQDNEVGLLVFLSTWANCLLFDQKCILMLPCCHLSICERCQEPLRARTNTCPMCRKPVNAHARHSCWKFK